MCRSIKVLRRPDTPVTPEEISAAALQFVRKVSGTRAPSKVNQPAFDGARNAPKDASGLWIRYAFAAGLAFVGMR